MRTPCDRDLDGDDGVRAAGSPDFGHVLLTLLPQSLLEICQDGSPGGDDCAAQEIEAKGRGVPTRSGLFQYTVGETLIRSTVPFPRPMSTHVCAYTSMRAQPLLSGPS
ncbi:hypothetical protein CEP54_004753 [Fusarium duplospermum]|uniref:Uncharacterized protein n=1 Tax=Fusarium duplospermum TaxID=1325734 RepID=A0A428QGD7_9HYPO|nr:hypothetical protein CEP54_004753 [Fusarium duplospermum]